MSSAARLALVDPAEPALSIVAQCQFLKVARSTLYYRPVAVGAEELTLMRRMDELHLAYPFYGSRRLAATLRREGWSVNRKRVKRLMQVMALETIYQKPNTSQPHPDHQRVLPLSVAWPCDRAGEPGLVCGHHLYSDGQGVCVSGGCDGLVQPSGAGVAGVDQHGHEISPSKRCRRRWNGTDNRTSSTPTKGFSSPVRTFWLNCRHAGFGSAWMAKVGIWTTSSSSGGGGA